MTATRALTLLLLSVVLVAVPARAGARPNDGPPDGRNDSAPVRPRDAERAARLARQIEAFEQQCLDEINRVRARHRLAPLQLHPELQELARSYSRRMAEEGFFDHRDPEGRNVQQRVSQAGIAWRVVGENLAYLNGYLNPVAVSVGRWMDSPGHRRNILAPDYQHTAIGVWIAEDGGVYFTEIFLRH